MLNQFSRTELLLGSSAMEKLKDVTVAVFGIGGVGGYVCEALARSGIEHFVLVDSDTVALTNINRQIIATLDTIGKYKCDCMKDRILSINKNAKVEVINKFFLPDNQDEFDFKSFDYVIDAVDTVTAKIAIILKAKENNIPIISAMGAGNKLNPAMLEVSDIYKTSVDPLAKVMRIELKKRHVNKLKVVYSKELPIKPNESNEDSNKREVPGSNAFVPTTMGLIIASEVIKDITGIRNDVKGA
ncbi:MAG: tRNA threonylcarbamoyladenosine dehydratase [Acholeplasmatales bacterium]|nr:tRNA threonylcarbamoyladenosine dehydratase [Acholeplasmatales bacterium]